MTISYMTLTQAKALEPAHEPGPLLRRSQGLLVQMYSLACGSGTA